MQIGDVCGWKGGTLPKSANENFKKIEDCLWDFNQISEALEILSRRAGFIRIPVDLPPIPDDLHGREDDRLNRWMEAAGEKIGIETESFESSFSDIEKVLRKAAPAIISIPDSGDPAMHKGFFILLKGGKIITFISPNLKQKRVKIKDAARFLRNPFIAPYGDAVEQLLQEAGVEEKRRDRARIALIQEQLGSITLPLGWLLRLSPGDNVFRQIAYEKLWEPLVTMLTSSLIQQALSLLAWWFIGRAAFGAQFDQAWLIAWGLLLFSGIPFQMKAALAQNEFSIRMGALFKQRLLYGILKLKPDEIRHQGMGQFLGRVMEADAVEMLAFGGGLTAVSAVITLFSAVGVLLIGPGGWMMAGLLLLLTVILVIQGWRYVRDAKTVISMEQSMTNNLVEKMVGHRTRLAQEIPQKWHTREDQELSAYLENNIHMDTIETQMSVIPNIWMVAGMAAVAFTLVTEKVTVTGLAISLGGVMLANQALSTIIAGIISFLQAQTAWSQVGPLFQAASRKEEGSGVAFLMDQNNLNGRSPVLTAKSLYFRYREHGKPALNECNLQIYPGDRILLEGPSGGGKTTLAAVFSGLRTNESGLLLLHGYDRRSIGSGEWRRKIAMAPQFHENYIFTETFSFNLLMGRTWPPTMEDLKEAEEICHELGLEELLKRMPSGWQQMVGESGWQLSHGERSRVYIARALLQKADLVIMDESFGALDPENLKLALQCALRRAKTLLVIAHP